MTPEIETNWMRVRRKHDALPVAARRHSLYNRRRSGPWPTDRAPSMKAVTRLGHRLGVGFSSVSHTRPVQRLNPLS